jgi:uncharacterized membrane protein YfcA
MWGTLAAAHSVTQPPGVTGGTWFFVIAASIAGALFRWIAPIVLFLLYLVLHTSTVSHVSHPSGNLTWYVLLVVGGFIGWQLGGRTVLRHIGEREWRNRIASAKGISSIWGFWFNDRL